MIERDIQAPIFFVGMPRSGTTVVFEIFAARPDVAWFSQHLDRAPRFPSIALVSRLPDLSPATRRSVGRSDQVRPWLEKLRVGPSEAYNVWQRCCGEKFLYDYLLGVEATAEERRCLRTTVSKVLRFQGKPRFAAKITGPGRIGYLSSVFQDARFVHVVRDGRAVVQSLMRVPFWRERRRMYEPAWQNGLTEDDLADWEAGGRSPLALAAVQWRRVVESIREEAARFVPDRYFELCYERFVVEPHDILDELAALLGFAPGPEAPEFLERRFELRDMNFQWGDRFRPGEVEMLDELMGSTLEELGYRVDPPQPPAGRARVERPFAATDHDEHTPPPAPVIERRFRAPEPLHRVEPAPPPSFSIVIAAYQAAHVIGDALDSALAQTAPAEEVIVCDDGSTDDLAAALDPYRGRIIVLRKENGGEASAKNAGARAVTGDFVVFLDADDVFMPERLAALGELAGARPDLDVLTTDAVLELDGQPVRGCYTDQLPFETVEQRTAILKRNFVFGLAAVRRSRLLAVGGFDEEIRWTTDWDCWIRLIFSGSRVGLVAEPLARYRLHSGSLSSQRPQLLAGRVQTLEKAALRDDLTAPERRVLACSIALERRLLALAEARAALLGELPGARRRSFGIVLGPGHALRTRVKAAAATIAPHFAASWLANRGRETTGGIIASGNSKSES